MKRLILCIFFGCSLLLPALADDKYKDWKEDQKKYAKEMKKQEKEMAKAQKKWEKHNQKYLKQQRKADSDWRS